MRLVRFLGAAATVCLFSAGAWAQADGPVKIGVLNDQSGLYADLAGSLHQLGAVRPALGRVRDLIAQALANRRKSETK